MNPNPAPAAPPEEPQIEIEYTDEPGTSAADRDQTPQVTPTEELIGNEEDDAQYGEQVQKRIKQLRYLSHNERRAKESAENEREAALEYARRVLEENTKLKSQLSTGERVLIGEAQARAEAQVESAKQNYFRALEANEPAEIVKAQEALTRAVASHDRISLYRPREAPQQQQPPPPQYQPPPQQQQHAQTQGPPDPAVQAFEEQHPWFGKVGYEDITGFAFGVHLSLLRQGIRPDNARAEDYWRMINEKLQERFPEQIGSGNRKAAAGQAQNGRPADTRPKPVVTTSGNRSSGGPIKVKLTPSQAQLCKKLGIPETEYAKQLLIQQQQQK